MLKLALIFIHRLAENDALPGRQVKMTREGQRMSLEVAEIEGHHAIRRLLADEDPTEQFRAGLGQVSKDCRSGEVLRLHTQGVRDRLIGEEYRPIQSQSKHMNEARDLQKSADDGGGVEREVEHVRSVRGGQPLEFYQAGKGRVQTKAAGHPGVRRSMGRAGVPCAKSGAVRPAGHQVKDAFILHIPECLETEEARPRINETRATQKCSGDGTFSTVRDPKA